MSMYEFLANKDRSEVYRQNSFPGETKFDYFYRLNEELAEVRLTDSLKKCNAKLFNEEIGGRLVRCYRGMGWTIIYVLLVVKLPVDGAVLVAPAIWPRNTMYVNFKLLTPFHKSFTKAVKSQIKSKLLAAFPKLMNNTESFRLHIEPDLVKSTMYVKIF